jgi:hypothetical protein
MGRRTYSTEAIAQAVATVRAEGSLKRASRLLGISRSTLRAWISGQLPQPVAAEGPEAFHKRQVVAGHKLASGYRAIEAVYQEHIKQPEVVAKASAAQSAVVIGVMSDKAVRAEGGPTSITETRVYRYIEPDALRDQAEAVLRGKGLRTVEVVRPAAELPAVTEAQDLS